MKNSVSGSRINLSKLEYNDIDSLLAPSGGNRTLKFEISSGSFSAPPTENKEGKGDGKGDGKGGESKNKSSDESTSKTDDSSQSGGSNDDGGLPEPPQFDPPATN